jgi:hypothetical protein
MIRRLPQLLVFPIKAWRAALGLALMPAPVKAGKVQCEHIFSALPLRADIAFKLASIRIWLPGNKSAPPNYLPVSLISEFPNFA